MIPLDIDQKATQDQLVSRMAVDEDTTTIKLRRSLCCAKCQAGLSFNGRPECRISRGIPLSVFSEELVREITFGITVTEIWTRRRNAKLPG